MPPDESELNAHSRSFLVEGVQTRKQAGANSTTRAVPSGLSPEEHAEFAMIQPPPLTSNTVILHDLQFAVDWAAGNAQRYILEYRRYLQFLKQLVADCGELRARLDANRSSSSQLVASKVDLVAIAVLA